MAAQYVSRTHPGYREGENEDEVACDPDHGLCFVADGMGGHAAGAVASNVVKRTLLSLAGQVPLDTAVLKAHEAVLADAASEPRHTGMGSTVVAAQLKGSKSTIVWVGDSRAYLWHRDTLRGVTRDHSFIEGLRAQHLLTEAELREHPQRHLVTQSLGIGSPIPSRIETRLHWGDWLLLCSDGLTDELDDDAIADVLRAHPKPEEAGDALIAAALERGGHDNVSVAIIAYGPPAIRKSLSALSERTLVVLAILTGIVGALAIEAVWSLLYRSR
ncbi:MAG TPA: protein phosphatase 2C domain-containing protein [Steroidobacteraceae bacterium]|nr:protein phosphatase 2C domain-containing protein [Steroidobacteraceae bacterium]